MIVMLREIQDRPILQAIQVYIQVYIQGLRLHWCSLLFYPGRVALLSLFLKRISCCYVHCCSAFATVPTKRGSEDDLES